uniref:Glycine N-acyltransferase-like protein n=1 Tax=Panthera leo TaxID=9689 RepID=A0A8C8XFD3_PANLE
TFFGLLQVYTTVFHMNQGNPFKLKAVVDKWPDFTTVVIRPQEQEMTDDFDHYTNTYQIYYKNPTNCQEFLGASDVINWKQHLQIQSSQSSLNEVIQNLAAAKLVKVKGAINPLLMLMSHFIKKIIISGNLVAESIPLSVFFSLVLNSNQEMFKLSSLDVTHTALVDKFWRFGGNERSQRFIKRCIQTFPTFCLLGPEGTPVSWSLMDQTGEIRMGGTVPEYRAQGLSTYVMDVHIRTMDKLDYPTYYHTLITNKIIQKISHRLHHIIMPCDWNQWHCEPL